MTDLRSLLLLSLLAAASRVACGDEALDWLNRMDSALRELNYEGDLVYLHGDQLEAMRLNHLLVDGREQERLISLNGPAREVLRDGDLVTCIQPERRSVSVGRRRPGGGVADWRTLEPDQLARHYDFVLGDETRIADRAAVQIRIVPKDEYRYGQRLWLDRQYALPLKSDRLNGEGGALSQLMFTGLRVGTSQGLAMQPPAADREGYQLVHEQPMEPVVKNGADRWAFVNPPPGFRLAAHSRRTPGGQVGEMDHFVFSDGLVTVSVYIEPVAAEGVLSGASQIGPVNVFGTSVQGHQVTVVGEVPPRTVQGMALAVRLVQAGGTK